LNRLVNSDKVLYGGDGIEYYLDYILFNPVVSAIPKWRTFKPLMCVKHLNRLLHWDENFRGLMALNITSTTYYLMP
jgi:hypothetical protein